MRKPVFYISGPLLVTEYQSRATYWTSPFSFYVVFSKKKQNESFGGHVLEPTNKTFKRPVVWSHPAFAEKCVFARNDKELVCVDLAAKK